MINRMKHRFKIPCGTQHLEDVRRFLNKVLSNYNLGDIDQNALVLAVDEVCANVIIHSCYLNPDMVVELTVGLEDRMLIFEIIDQGGASGFDISSYHGPDIDKLIKTGKKGGVGIMLVRKIMDKIEMVSQNGKNICRLYKNL